MFHPEKMVYSLKTLVIRKIESYKEEDNLFQNLLSKFFPSYCTVLNARREIDRLSLHERTPGNSSINVSDILSLENELKAFNRRQLMRFRIGLQYRLGREGGGADPRALGYVEYRLLEKWAESWKKGQQTCSDKTLAKKEKKHLKSAARYGLFVDLLLEDEKLRHKFFLWTLRDGNAPEPFIEFPFTVDWLIKSDLGQRLGRFENLVGIKNLNGLKVVTVRFEGNPVSILDPDREIEFRGSFKKTISEIFEVFRNKYKKVGDFEVFQEGIINWNTFKMGYWDDSIKEYILVDFLKEDWWKDLPYFETLTKEQAEERYGTSIDGASWVAAVTATRGNINLSYEQTHAFMELAIPDERGRFHIYDFGKYGRFFPKNLWDGLKKFTLTMLASVMYPDENVYYSQRQTGYYPFIISPEEGKKLLNSVRQEIFRCMAGLSVYQIESENCAKWTVELLKDALDSDLIPNLYKMSLLDCEPGGLMQKLFNLIKKLPKYSACFCHYTSSLSDRCMARRVD